MSDKQKTFDEVIKPLWKIMESCGLKGKVSLLNYGDGKLTFYPLEKLDPEKWVEFQQKVVNELKPVLDEYWKGVREDKIIVQLEFSEEVITVNIINSMKYSTNPERALQIGLLLARGHC